MSETARSLHRERTYTTQTVGNLTTIFFRNAEAGAPSGSDFFGQPGRNVSCSADMGDFFGPHAEEEVAPAAREPEQISFSIPSVPVQAETPKAPTARQRELAKPDTADMATEALQNYAQLHDLLDWFDQRGKIREVCLLTFGFCTGLRISDLVSLKVGDIVTSLNPIAFKSCIDIREQKTGKRTVSHLDEMLITPAMQQAFIRYITKTRPTSVDQYLFVSRESHGVCPMSVRQMRHCLEPGFKAVVPHLHCATHTMRKTFVSIIHTFSSQSQMQGGGLNPATVCQIALRHNSATTTLAYMGVVKAGMVSLRRAVSDFVQGRTVIKSLECTYTWALEDDDD